MDERKKNPTVKNLPPLISLERETQTMTYMRKSHEEVFRNNDGAAPDSAAAPFSFEPKTV